MKASQKDPKKKFTRIVNKITEKQKEVENLIEKVKDYAIELEKQKAIIPDKVNQ
jgi:hypothetical protein